MEAQCNDLNYYAAQGPHPVIRRQAHHLWDRPSATRCGWRKQAYAPKLAKTYCTFRYSPSHTSTPLVQANATSLRERLEGCKLPSTRNLVKRLRCTP